MRTNRPLALLVSLAVAAALTAACAKKEAPAAGAAPAEAPTPVGGGKIPITTSSPEARSEFLQGRELFDKLQFTDAAEHFRKAVAADPNFAWAELFVANTSPTGADFFEHLNKAVNLADKASNGEKLVILAAQAGANGDVTKQKEYLDDLVAAYPYAERAHFALGGWYFGQQNYQQAIDHYRRATELDPNYSSAFNLLGYAYRQSGDYPDAEKAFQHYITLIPKDPNPYDSYAELLLKMGRYDDAIAQYRKALAIAPNFINAYQGIAMAELYSGKPGEAAKELANIPKQARTDAERRTGMFALTIVEIDGGKLARALEEVKKQYELGVKTRG
jgi:tetratricopeptide (TPR) repeat protein